jgi:predicted ribosomally synthesized peptide with SipW-like signal peptide
MTIKGVLRAVLSARGRAALSLGVVASIGATGTFAYWTDNVAVTGTTFTAGTIDLRVNDLDTVTGYTALNLATMVPGNSVAGVLTVKNNGTAPLKWTMSSSASNGDSKNLAGSLSVKVTNGTVSGTSPAATCGGTVISSASSLNGPLVTTGQLLAAGGGGSQTICVQVTLDPNAPSSVQGGTSNIGFSFTGTSDLS